VKRVVPELLIDVIRSTPPLLGRCRGEACRRRIEWVQTVKGKRLPVDHPLRVVREFARHDGTLLTVIDTARVHWATCADVDQFRRKRAPQKGTR
jgi:hypothetical protein